MEKGKRDGETSFQGKGKEQVSQERTISSLKI